MARFRAFGLNFGGGSKPSISGRIGPFGVVLGGGRKRKRRSNESDNFDYSEGDSFYEYSEPGPVYRHPGCHIEHKRYGTMANCKNGERPSLGHGKIGGLFQKRLTDEPAIGYHFQSERNPIIQPIQNTSQAKNEESERKAQQKSNAREQYKVGIKVTHPSLGDGTITRVHSHFEEVNNGALIVDVDFGFNNVKSINLKWNDLKIQSNIVQSKSKLSYGEFSSGDRITHKTFGNGTITRIEENNSEFFLTVDFDDGPSKTLNMKWNNIYQIGV